MSDSEPTQFQDPSPIFDSFDVDLVLKVLSHTLFSPFFTLLIPIFYFFQGMAIRSPAVVGSFAYYLLVSAFWSIKWYSRLYRNQGKLLYGPAQFDWGEQIVVITGGSSGIGELLANTLAVRNVSVVVLDVNPIVTENSNITYYKCDVSKWEDVEAVSKTIIDEIGHPTVLVNNAGVVQGKLLLDLTPKDIMQTFGVNTLAHFWVLKAFLPELIRQKAGHIISVSSVMGLAGCAQMTDYCASKAALVSLHESLRYELDKRYEAPKIRTTLVVPGHILTPLFSRITLPRNAFFKFFFPSVAPVTIVKAVIAALDEQHSRTIYLPFYAHFTGLLALMPSFIRDAAQKLTYADYAMQGFVKVSGRRSDEGAVAGSKKE
ncbi:retinal short-chain dehydrogenase/reductase [Athelia psychrophila]|uniref:Short-chain dehydrogenase/reductase 3 n=1 Tax=Athelia psychrophila TaxID=1759441 RepID=A0A166IUZ0_9AGAM|nr:retinal short-chain dehydrogenase/reductase [Fibularhizoctonia sp. CBS 109695]